MSRAGKHSHLSLNMLSGQGRLYLLGKMSVSGKSGGGDDNDDGGTMATTMTTAMAMSSNKDDDDVDYDDGEGDD